MQKEIKNPRAKHFGGSDLGIVLGLSNHKTRLDLWLEKTNRKEPFGENLATLAGHALENLILDTYEKTKGCTLRRQIPLAHPRYSWAGGTADGIDDKNNIIVDAKASGSTGMWGNGPPKTVYAQMQWYMLLSGMRRAEIALLLADSGWSYTTHIIDRDDAFCNAALEAALQFWAHVLDDTPPPPQTYDDVMILIPQAIPKSYLEATAEHEEAVQRYCELRDANKQAELEMKELRDSIALAMMDKEMLVDHSGSVIAKSSMGKYGRTIRILG